MDNLNEMSIEKLVLNAARKNITVDDILTTDHTVQEFENAYEWFRLSSIYRTSLIKTWEEKHDCMTICNMVIRALKNKEVADTLEEKYSTDGEIELDMSWDDNDEEDIPAAKDVYDALTLSLANKACVDIEYISKCSGLNKDEVIDKLNGLIYQNPDTWNIDRYQGWETSDQYLSGNMARKLKTAKAANKEHEGLFLNNIRAIKKIYPEIIEAEDIYISLGSPWIPTTVIDDFIEYLLGKPDNPERIMYSTKHDTISGTWECPNGGRYTTSNVGYTITWGTKKCPALRIIENSLNMKKVFIYDHTWGRDEWGEYGETVTINKEETALAQEKQRLVNEEFKNWVWDNPKRKRELLAIYEDNYASFVRRKYDGSYLTFPGMSDEVELFDYQKDVVARILYSKNTLLAHDVGSGKTYEMIAAGMELRRTGLGHKLLYVVPNSIVGQWKNIFLMLYPDANVKVVEPGNFSTAKRQKVLADIKDNDYDAIIMAYSCFDLIPLSRKAKIDRINEERIKVAKSRSSVSSDTNVMSKRAEALFKKVIEEEAKKKDEGITFDMLGIDHMFIDEAHNYKNVPIQTKMTGVLGINAAGSKKCAEMLEKVQYIQKKNNGGGIVMATGTPITNSITEAYIIQLYLQKGVLELLDLQSFDSWCGLFSEVQTNFEIDVTTNSYRFATRFSKFHNLPELTNLLSMVADFHHIDNQSGIPEFEGYTDVTVKKTPEMQEYLNEISNRADEIRCHYVNSKEDNMLKVTTDARKAALDLRLINHDKYDFTRESKIAKCAKNVFLEYMSGISDNTTQLVFCDSSTPKDGFNMYDELSSLLVNMGIPHDKIAYIHDACTDEERNALYEKVRKGEIRILIGSTFKLGIGVNVQERVKALHHLDIPWRPADMTQREGRILRQGNLNKSVNIYRYVTEGSFDAYSWQLLETKQRFITDILSGVMDERDGEDVDETVLSYAEVKALALGNPEMKEREELTNEIARLRILSSKNSTLKKEAEKELMELPSRIKIIEDIYDKAKEDETYVNSLELDKEVELTKTEKEVLQEERKSIREKLDEAIRNNILMPAERILMEYNGFTIILPKSMGADHPYVYAQRVGRYPIEMGDSETGNLIRVDNFFTGFSKTVKEKKEALERAIERQKGLEAEIEREDPTEEQIENLNIRLNEINERLELAI